MGKNLSLNFKRLRRSPNFNAIHDDVVSGVPITSITKKIQGRWHEMTDVTPRTLERQLTRYKEAIMLDKAGMRERGIEKGLPAMNGSVGWAQKGVDQAHDALKGEDTPTVPEGVSGDTPVSQGNDNVLSFPGSNGGLAIPTVEEFSSRDHMIGLYARMLTRIDMEMENERNIKKLIPGMAVEMSVAKDILKSIAVMEGDYTEPNTGGGGNVNIDKIQINVEEKMIKAGLGGILNSDKSRKRILTALRTESREVGVLTEGTEVKGDTQDTTLGDTQGDIPSGIAGEDKHISDK